MLGTQFFTKPKPKETAILVGSLAVWLLVTAIFIGLRVDHIFLGALIVALFFTHPISKKLLVAFVPFALFGLSYDWMKLYPNYMVNHPVTVELYNFECTLFGITGSDGNILTLNEFFAAHTSTFADVMAGVFYLCWVPVPMAFALWLFFNKQMSVCIRFGWAFLFVNLLGFTLYYILPAAPPWYYFQYGSDVLTESVGSAAGLSRFDEFFGANIFNSIYSRNSNVFAAFPSLHSAYPVVAFIYSLRAKCNIAVRVIFGIIMVGIWWAAVYSQHHYLTDVVAGALLATLGVLVFELLYKKYSKPFDSYAGYVRF